MTTLEFTLNLPDELASKAQAAGLNSEAIARLLREQLRKEASEPLRVMLNKVDASDLPPMTEDETRAEIDAYNRAERRAKRSTAS